MAGKPIKHIRNASNRAIILYANFIFIFFFWQSNQENFELSGLHTENDVIMKCSVIFSLSVNRFGELLKILNFIL